ncbi:hypothetical protein YC2023_050139 [Brassica napus]
MALTNMYTSPEVQAQIIKPPPPSIEKTPPSSIEKSPPPSLEKTPPSSIEKTPPPSIEKPPPWKSIYHIPKAHHPLVCCLVLNPRSYQRLVRSQSNFIGSKNSSIGRSSLLFGSHRRNSGSHQRASQDLCEPPSKSQAEKEHNWCFTFTAPCQASAEEHISNPTEHSENATKETQCEFIHTLWLQFSFQEKKTDDCLVGSQSPILSQYQLHQHEDSLRSPHHPSPTHQQTDHQSQDHQPPADHDTHNHKSLTCLASTTDDHQTPNTQTPPHCGLPHPSPNHHSSDHHSHDHRSPDHHSPNHHYSDHHSHDHRSPDHHSPDHRSPDQHSHDHQSPDDHSKIPTTLSSHQTPHQQSPLHPSSADHPNVNHQTAIPSESTLLSSDRHSTDHHSPAPQTPEHKTPHHITPNHQTLEHKSSDSNSPTHSPPIHVSTPSSPPTHKPPADAFNLIQGSPSQHYAQIAILPQFDATPLEKPTSLEVMSGSDPATISAPFKPAGTTTPNSTPTKPAVSPQAFSPHSSSPNAFAALKGSTNTFLSTPNHQTGKVTVFSHPQPTTFYIGLLTHFYNGCRMAKNRKWIKKIPTPAPRTLKYERLLQKLMYCLHSLP